MPDDPMWVIATAGPAEAGKTTLVRTLTGMTPTMGAVWTGLPSGRAVTLLDAPATAITAVLFVVAADRGWQPQAGERLAALHALGVRHGVVVVTRSDLAEPVPVLRRARAELAGTSLADAELVAVSGRTGRGMTELLAALDRLAARLPCPDSAADVRLWVDQASGPTVTGTLPGGTLHAGDELVVAPGGRRVRVGSVRSVDGPAVEVTAARRVSVCLQGIDTARVRRGQALVAVGGWRFVSVVDVRLRFVERTAMPARDLALHVGSAVVAVRMRRLGPSAARLTLNCPLPLRIGDLGLLRDAVRHAVVAGVTVLDIMPPPINGSGAARAIELSQWEVSTDGAAELRRRGMVRRKDLVVMGCTVPRAESMGEWLFDADRLRELRAALVEAVCAYSAEHPADPAMPKPVAAAAIGLPDRRLVEPLARAARGLGVRLKSGRLVLCPVNGIAALCRDLAGNPFAAPGQARLTELGLTVRALNSAVAQGILLCLGNGVYVRADAVERAGDLLAGLPEPFTVAQARTALGTTRRVAVPLLELLDERGVTERLDDSRRRLRKGRRT